MQVLGVPKLHIEDTYLVTDRQIKISQDSFSKNRYTETVMSNTGKVFSGFLEFIRATAIVLVVAFVLRAYAVQPFIVDGQSMEPNLHTSDYILVEKFSYYFRAPQSGDVIVFRAPERPDYNYVKRVIAGPGDRVEIKNGNVYVNGSRLKESYIPTGEPTFVSGTLDVNYHKTMSTDQYFVLGDNRNSSSDSRDWGPVPKVNIVGRAWVTVYPLRDFGGVMHAQPQQIK